MGPAPFLQVVADRPQRVGGAGVLGEAFVIEVHPAGVGVEADVFQDGPKVAHRLPDQRLLFGPQPDGLGIAAALQVEDAVIAPSMFVIADQAPPGVGGEGGLSSAGQAEEQGHIAGGPHVGRAMHTEHPLAREQVVQYGEDGLLDLAGVAGAADQDQAAAEVQDDEDLGMGAFLLRQSVEARCIEDGELRHVLLQTIMREAQKQVAGEQTVPGVLADHPKGQPIARIGPGRHVLHKKVTPVQVGRHPAMERIEMLFRERLVDLSPPQILLGAEFADDEFVAG